MNTRPETTEKYCGHCKQNHPATDFGPDKKTKDGLHYYCRKSLREQMKSYYHTRYKFRR